MVSMLRVVKHLKHFRIVEVNVGLLVWATIATAAVDSLASCETSEFHDVAS